MGHATVCSAAIALLGMEVTERGPVEGARLAQGTSGSVIPQDLIDGSARLLRSSAGDEDAPRMLEEQDIIPGTHLTAAEQTPSAPPTSGHRAGLRNGAER